MSSKPYFVLNVIEGRPGVMRERATFAMAVDLAVLMAKEQCDVDENEIRKELEEDYDFIPRGGGFSVHILQTEDN